MGTLLKKLKPGWGIIGIFVLEEKGKLIVVFYFVL